MSRSEKQYDDFILNLISNQVTIYLYMLGPLMKHRVLINIYDCLIITEKHSKLWMKYF